MIDESEIIQGHRMKKIKGNTAVCVCWEGGVKIHMEWLLRSQLSRRDYCLLRVKEGT